MRQLRVDQNELCNAYFEGNWRRRYYLDSLSGEILNVTEKVRADLQIVYDEVGEEEAVNLLTVPEYILAHQIEMDDERYLKIPECEASLKADAFDTFADSADSALRPLLWGALDRNDFAAFERMLALETDELSRWQRFTVQITCEVLGNWLRSEGIEPLFF